MSQDNRAAEAIGVADLEDYFTRYGWVADRIDETSIQTGLSEGNLVLPVVVQIDDGYIYFRMFLFPNAALDQETDYLRLMRINDSAPVLKLSVGSANELVAGIEYLVDLMDYDLFETTLNMLSGFIGAFYEDIAAAVSLVEVDGAE